MSTQTAVTAAAVPTHRPGTYLYEAGGVVLLLDQSTSARHRLNPMALAVWELCDGETTVGEMVTAMCDLFSADPDVVAADVIAVFEAFSEQLLVNWRGAGGDADG
ncbi:MAG: PqqD family protein [Mycobacteriales bacterium]